MRGRRPKPAALKRAQGNPGRRKLPAEPKEAKPKSVKTTPAESMPFVSLSSIAQQTYEVVGGALRSMNFLRASDEPTFLRYCDLFARYVTLAAEVNKLGGETYECVMTGGVGKMTRMRPQFGVMLLIAKRLESMEDRLGLSPAARMQYLQRVQSAGVQGQFGFDQPQADGDAGGKPPAPSPQQESPVGMLNALPRNALN